MSKVISLSVTYSQSDIDFREVMDIGGRGVRVNICSNAYQHQSHARVEVLDPATLRWNTVHYILPNAMHIRQETQSEPAFRQLLASKGGVNASTAAHYFKEDRDELLRVYRELTK